MINCTLQLRNRWTTDYFRNIWNKSSPVIRNKFGEIEVMVNKQILLLVHLRLTTKQDHSGLELELGLFGIVISARVVDCRHWDYNNSCFIHYNPTKIY